ncbi:DNA gyrase inhibitor YacG [Bartonella sp. CB175]|uniref:DNA gyrase inhibitor YacG n=1 Tax=Bartonella sp. CB175 TaxID=3112256 RepID=UPI00300E43CD
MEHSKEKQKEGSLNKKEETSEMKLHKQVTKMSQIQKELSATKIKISPRHPAHPCPICGQMSQQDAYPFCSKRCRAIDLNRWLSGAYVLPAPQQETDEEE